MNNFQSIKNLFFFQNGSIGDFLMTIFFMENVHLSNPKLNLYIVVPRNKSFFKEMIISYNYLNVVEANKSNLGVPLVKFLFDSNYVVVPPTAGSIPLRVKILARIISLMPRSFLVGFKDLSKFNFFYDKFFKFDTTIFYLDVMKNLLQEIGFSLKKMFLVFGIYPIWIV